MGRSRCRRLRRGARRIGNLLTCCAKGETTDSHPSSPSNGSCSVSPLRRTIPNSVTDPPPHPALDVLRGMGEDDETQSSTGDLSSSVDQLPQWDDLGSNIEQHLSHSESLMTISSTSNLPRLQWDDFESLIDLFSCGSLTTQSDSEVSDNCSRSAAEEFDFNTADTSGDETNETVGKSCLDVEQIPLVVMRDECTSTPFASAEDLSEDQSLMSVSTDTEVEDYMCDLWSTEACATILKSIPDNCNSPKEDPAALHDKTLHETDKREHLQVDSDQVGVASIAMDDSMTAAKSSNIQGKRCSSGMFEVKLIQGVFGLGLTLGSDELKELVIIDKIKLFSPAAMQRQLRIGDRILEINGHSVVGKSPPQAETILSLIKWGEEVIILAMPPQQTVVFHFSKTANAGVITMKLNTSFDKPLGVDIEGGLDTECSHIRISAIKRGSVADRCGMLRVGDELLQIDQHLMAGTTHREAIDILGHIFKPITLTVQRRENLNLMDRIQSHRSGPKMTYFD